MCERFQSFKSFFNYLKEERIIKDPLQPPQVTDQLLDSEDKISPKRRKIQPPQVTVCQSDRDKRDRAVKNVIYVPPPSFQTESSSDSVTNPFTDDDDDSLSDWVPATDDDEDDDEEYQRSNAEQKMTEMEVELDNDKTAKFRVENSCDSLSITYPMLSQSHTPEATEPETIEPEISVAESSTSSNKWNKRHACKYCRKLVTKMSTHLKRVHKDESEVIKVLMMKLGSKERRHAWGKLLNDGDYEHNFSTMQQGKGTIIPKYRCKKRTLEECVTCPYCRAMYLKSLLARHVAVCRDNPGISLKRGQSVRDGSLLMPVPTNCTTGFFQNVLQHMKQDDVLRLIKNDHLLICFGERLYYRKDIEEHTAGHISGRLRELGRLLKIFRHETKMKVSNMTQILHVSNFDLLVKCIRQLADFDEDINQFRKGTLALKIGYSIKKCASILKAEAIKKHDLELRQQASSFEELISGNWYDLISATANQSVYRAKQNKPRLLPVCEDIAKVHNLLMQKVESEDYVTIAKATLCQISLFNRKRGGEVQRMKLEDFERGMTCGVSSNKDMLQGLTESEKKMMGYFNRIEIRGKFNRTVPILLTAQMVKSIKKLIELRQNLNLKHSPYLFATPTGSRPFRGSDVIREFAKEANVKDLSVFTFTHLRKQVATLSQTMEISKWEQDQLAKFLGHDIRVHRNIYRQPSEVLDRAKVAKILMNVNKGMSVSQDVTVAENEELDEDEDESVDEDEDEMNVVSNVQEEDHCPEPTDEEPLMTSQTKDTIENRQASKSKGDNYKGKSSKKQPPLRKTWSEEEKQAVKKQLNACIVMCRVPKKHEAEHAIANEPVLRQRTWRNIKDFVYNIVKRNKI